MPSLVSIEGKDEKLTIELRPLEIKLDPDLQSALVKFLVSVSDLFDWLHRK